MASYERYIDHGEEDEDFDEIDNSQRLNASSRIYNYPIEYNYYNSPRDLTLNLPKTTTNSSFNKSYQPIYESPESDNSDIQRYLGVSVSLISLITENIISHPFIVMRRQCQVYHNSRHYHIFPMRMVAVIVSLQRRQGIATMWKGLGSTLLVRGMSLAVEDILSKFTPWPKEINSRTSLKQFGQHLVLKAISIGIVLPFYSASLVETVQSDIASEKPHFLDVFREGSARWLSWSVPAKGRMLPVWALIPSGTCIGLSKYLFSVIVKGISTRLLTKHIQKREEKQGARRKDLTAINNEVELTSNLISLIMSEVLFYPFETILHRIQLQGTRTIIDNLDTGKDFGA
jgi:solute carrier family 25, member 46